MRAMLDGGRNILNASNLAEEQVLPVYGIADEAAFVSGIEDIHADGLRQ